MLTALCDKLAIVPTMRLKDSATFLGGEVEVKLTCNSIRRALKVVSWSKKATQNIAQERNPDLRDEIHTLYKRIRLLSQAVPSYQTNRSM